MLFKFNYTNLKLSELYQLGSCLVSSLSDQYLANIDPVTFITFFPYIGISFQPNLNQSVIISSLIESYVNNNTLMNGSTHDDIVFSTLGHLALFYPFSTYADQITTVNIYFKFYS